MTALFRRRPEPFRRPARSGVGTALVFALVMGASLVPGGTVLAQDKQIQTLLQRIDRLQRDMNTLQRQIYRGEPPSVPADGTLVKQGGMTNTAAARIELRLSRFETELRQITGQVEEAAYRNNQLRARLERLAAETDLRLRQLEQGVPPTAATQGAPAGQLAPATGAGDQAAFASQPRVLGTIDPTDLTALRAQPVESASPAAQPGAQRAAAPGYALAGQTPEEQYQHAFGLLSQANYGEAELALRAFVQQNPKDPLAGNAKYWLGETYYVRQDYQQAAVTFAEAYQEYPGSKKAPDNLLKLGMSLSVLGSKPDACGTFAELLKRYPEAAATVLQRAQQERQRLACP